MAYNLARNSRVFVTTALTTASGEASTLLPTGALGTSTGANQIKGTAFNIANTWELQVMDGFKFGQATATTAVQLKEAGATPNRAERTFNTALNPVDISFSTYIRPRKNSGQATAEERVLWNALLGSVGINGTSQAGATVTAVTVTGTVTNITRSATTVAAATITGSSMVMTGISAGDLVFVRNGGTAASMNYWNGPAIIGTVGAAATTLTYLTVPEAAAGTVCTTTSIILDKAAWTEMPSNAGNITYAEAHSAFSNKNVLQSLGFIFVVDNSTYAIENCAIDQAQIDFGLDGIAMINWTIKGTRLIQVASQSTLTDNSPGTDASTVVFTVGTLQGTAQGKVTSANYITNKLSTVQVKSTLGNVADTGGTTYSVVLTGGSMTIANNITYVTPNNIGVVNAPIGYFTGTRAVSGTLNAYLKTASNETAQLLTDILSNASTNTDTKYRMQLEIGGAGNGTRVEVELPGAMLGVPSVDVADVIATAITFNAQSIPNTVYAGSASQTYDMTTTNDFTVRYYSA
jgi:hypothetical protein